MAELLELLEDFLKLSLDNYRLLKGDRLKKMFPFSLFNITDIYMSAMRDIISKINEKETNIWAIRFRRKIESWIFSTVQ